MTKQVQHLFRRDEGHCCLWCKKYFGRWEDWKNVRAESQAVEFTLHMRGILQLLKESEESDLIQAAL